MRLLGVLILSLLSASPRQWNDSTRDIYVDGKLDRNAQVLVSAGDGPRLLAVVCGDEVLILDPASKSVARTTKSSFAFSADRTSATTAAELEPARAGEVAKVEPSTFVARAGDRTIVVTTHQSSAGPMTIETLWETMPVWRSIADAYAPDADVVAQLRAIAEPTQLEVVLATWCGDSKKYVPRLLKAVEAANNPHIAVKLTGVGPDFESPMELIQNLSVTNVPTVIVTRDGRELGRYVETPAGASIEGDVADIVHARQRPHPGRIERGAKLAEGTYAITRGRRTEGRETFTIYARPGGGSIAHSMLARADGTKIETWASIDGEQRPRSAEITIRANGKTTRTRYRYDAGQWYATSRGATGGIVTQTMDVPDVFSVITPSTISYGWARGATYVADAGGTGALREMTFEVRMDERLGVPRIVVVGDERRVLGVR